MTQIPTVSVIITTYNRADLVTEAIQSVFSQTYQDYELIVVDDGSEDNTRDVLRQFEQNIIYIYQSNQGPSVSKNTGIDISRGKYIAFLDSDDIWLPEKLEKQVRILDEYKDTGLVYTNFIVADEKGNRRSLGYGNNDIVHGYILENILLCKTHCMIITWLVRKKCFEEVGGFNTDFRASEDREMLARLAKKYKLYGIDEPLAVIKVHPNIDRVSGGKAEAREFFYFKFLEKVFNDIDPTLPKGIKRKLLGHYHRLAGDRYLKELNLSAARKRYIQSVQNSPFRLKTYFHFFSSLMGRRILRIFIESRRLIFHKWKRSKP